MFLLRESSSKKHLHFACCFLLLRRRRRSLISQCVFSGDLNFSGTQTIPFSCRQYKIALSRFRDVDSCMMGSADYLLQPQRDTKVAQRRERRKQIPFSFLLSFSPFHPDRAAGEVYLVLLFSFRAGRFYALDFSESHCQRFIHGANISRRIILTEYRGVTSHFLAQMYISNVNA